MRCAFIFVLGLLLTAWTHGASEVSAPSFATAVGISSTPTGAESFDTASTIDTTNSLTAGKNWYLNNFPTWAPNGAGCQNTICGCTGSCWSPMTLAHYNVTAGALNILSQTSTLSDGADFASSGYTGSGLNNFGVGLPLIPGNKPFYIEARISCDAVNGIFWIQDQSAITRSILGTGGSTALFEADIVENCSQQNIHVWTSPTASTGGTVATPAISAGVPFTVGFFVCTSGFAGCGSGFSQFYFNRVTSGATITGTQQAAIEASAFMIFISSPLSVFYVYWWEHP